MQYKNQKGFTLVELAIVMVIVGILITGVLKGQELVNNARVNSTVNQMKSIDAAVATFKDIYRALPGDITNVTNRLPNCTATPCISGDGNGRINNAAAGVTEVIAAPAAPAAGIEAIAAFAHMNAADLLSGVDGTATVGFGNGLPESSIGGGFWIGYEAAGTETGFGAALRTGHYMVLNGQPVTVAAGTGGLTASQGARIDRKLDDGMPNTGLVRGLQGATGCATAATAATAYQESNETAQCALISRLQN